MVKTLQKHGNSHALVLDKTLMDLVGITPETPINVRVESGNILLSPVAVGGSREAIADSIARLRPRYTQMLRNLAGDIKEQG